MGRADTGTEAIGVDSPGLAVAEATGFAAPVATAGAGDKERSKFDMRAGAIGDAAGVPAFGSSLSERRNASRTGAGAGCAAGARAMATGGALAAGILAGAKLAGAKLAGAEAAGAAWRAAVAKPASVTVARTSGASLHMRRSMQARQQPAK